MAIAGQLAGTFLFQISTFGTTWQNWRLAHPETEVMAVPPCPFHRDARHGYGWEEIK